MSQINMSRINSLKNLWILLCSLSAAVVTTLMMDLLWLRTYLYSIFKVGTRYRALPRGHSYDYWHLGMNEEWPQICMLVGHDQFL
jgi:hypothetical protein